MLSSFDKRYLYLNQRSPWELLVSLNDIMWSFVTLSCIINKNYVHSKISYLFYVNRYKHTPYKVVYKATYKWGNAVGNGFPDPFFIILHGTISNTLRCTAYGNYKEQTDVSCHVSIHCLLWVNVFPLLLLYQILCFNSIQLHI